MITGGIATILTFLVEIQTLAEMVSIGSLFAMLVVCGCVLTNRYSCPEKPSYVPCIINLLTLKEVNSTPNQTLLLGFLQSNAGCGNMDSVRVGQQASGVGVLLDCTAFWNNGSCAYYLFLLLATGNKSYSHILYCALIIILIVHFHLYLIFPHYEGEYTWDLQVSSYASDSHRRQYLQYLSNGKPWRCKQPDFAFLPHSNTQCMNRSNAVFLVLVRV